MERLQVIKESTTKWKSIGDVIKTFNELQKTQFPLSSEEHSMMSEILLCGAAFLGKNISPLAKFKECARKYRQDLQMIIRMEATECLEQIYENLWDNFGRIMQRTGNQSIGMDLMKELVQIPTLRCNLDSRKITYLLRAIPKHKRVEMDEDLERKVVLLVKSTFQAFPFESFGKEVEESAIEYFKDYWVCMGKNVQHQGAFLSSFVRLSDIIGYLDDDHSPLPILRRDLLHMTLHPNWPRSISDLEWMEMASKMSVRELEANEINPDVFSPDLIPRYAVTARWLEAWAHVQQKIEPIRHKKMMESALESLMKKINSKRFADVSDIRVMIEMMTVFVRNIETDVITQHQDQLTHFVQDIAHGLDIPSKGTLISEMLKKFHESNVDMDSAAYIQSLWKDVNQTIVKIGTSSRTGNVEGKPECEWLTTLVSLWPERCDIITGLENAQMVRLFAHHVSPPALEYAIAIMQEAPHLAGSKPDLVKDAVLCAMKMTQETIPWESCRDLMSRCAYLVKLCLLVGDIKVADVLMSRTKHAIEGPKKRGHGEDSESDEIPNSEAVSIRMILILREILGEKSDIAGMRKELEILERKGIEKVTDKCKERHLKPFMHVATSVSLFVLDAPDHLCHTFEMAMASIISLCVKKESLLPPLNEFLCGVLSTGSSFSISLPRNWFSNSIERYKDHWSCLDSPMLNFMIKYFSIQKDDDDITCKNAFKHGVHLVTHSNFRNVSKPLETLSHLLSLMESSSESWWTENTEVLKDLCNALANGPEHLKLFTEFREQFLRLLRLMIHNTGFESVSRLKDISWMNFLGTRSRNIFDVHLDRLFGRFENDNNLFGCQKTLDIFGISEPFGSTVADRWLEIVHHILKICPLASSKLSFFVDRAISSSQLQKSSIDRIELVRSVMEENYFDVIVWWIISSKKAQMPVFVRDIDQTHVEFVLKVTKSGIPMKEWLQSELQRMAEAGHCLPTFNLFDNFVRSISSIPNATLDLPPQFPIFDPNNMQPVVSSFLTQCVAYMGDKEWYHFLHLFWGKIQTNLPAKREAWTRGFTVFLECIIPFRDAFKKYVYVALKIVLECTKDRLSLPHSGSRAFEVWCKLFAQSKEEAKEIHYPDDDGVYDAGSYPMYLVDDMTSFVSKALKHVENLNARKCIENLRSIGRHHSFFGQSGLGSIVDLYNVVKGMDSTCMEIEENCDDDDDDDDDDDNRNDVLVRLVRFLSEWHVSPKCLDIVEPLLKVLQHETTRLRLFQEKDGENLGIHVEYLRKILFELINDRTSQPFFKRIAASKCIALLGDRYCEKSMRLTSHSEALPSLFLRDFEGIGSPFLDNSYVKEKINGILLQGNDPLDPNLLQHCICECVCHSDTVVSKASVHALNNMDKCISTLRRIARHESITWEASGSFLTYDDWISFHLGKLLDPILHELCDRVKGLGEFFFLVTISAKFHYRMDKSLSDVLTFVEAWMHECRNRNDKGIPKSSPEFSQLLLLLFSWFHSISISTKSLEMTNFLSKLQQNMAYVAVRVGHFDFAIKLFEEVMHRYKMDASNPPQDLVDALYDCHQRLGDGDEMAGYRLLLHGDRLDAVDFLADERNDLWQFVELESRLRKRKQSIHFAAAQRVTLNVMEAGFVELAGIIMDHLHRNTNELIVDPSNIVLEAVNLMSASTKDSAFSHIQSGILSLKCVEMGTPLLDLAKKVTILMDGEEFLRTHHDILWGKTYEVDPNCATDCRNDDDDDDVVIVEEEEKEEHSALERELKAYRDEKVHRRIHISWEQGHDQLQEILVARNRLLERLYIHSSTLRCKAFLIMERIENAKKILSCGKPLLALSALPDLDEIGIPSLKFLSSVVKAKACAKMGATDMAHTLLSKLENSIHIYQQRSGFSPESIESLSRCQLCAMKNDILSRIARFEQLESRVAAICGRHDETHENGIKALFMFAKYCDESATTLEEMLSKYSSFGADPSASPASGSGRDDLQSQLDQFKKYLHNAIASYAKVLTHDISGKRDLLASFRYYSCRIKADEEIETSLDDVHENLPPSKFVLIAYQIATTLAHKSYRWADELLKSMIAQIPNEVGWSIRLVAECMRYDIRDRAMYIREKILNFVDQTFAARLDDVSRRYRVLHSNSRDQKNIESSEIPVLTSSSTKMDALSELKFLKTSETGLSKPIFLTAISSNGLEYAEIYKAEKDRRAQNSDVRRDFVIQQVFDVTNRVLFRTPACSSRGMHIRTYRVIPFSQKEVVLECVRDAYSLRQYLIGAKGGLKDCALHRFRDMTQTHEFRDFAEAYAKFRHASPHELLSVFKHICADFNPVFRYFFFENFPDAKMWHSRRLAYIRSCATTSFVGYLLGVGDRHISNILIDRNTAEVVHIDFGISFDVGQLLNKPERVPFRMTPNIVDGMGPRGLHGAFSVTSQEVLHAMRANHDVFLAIVEVIQRFPPTRREAISIDTKKMVRSVQDRLHGYTDGDILSVEGQVRAMIDQATDPENLCQMFAGWLPFV